MARRLRGAPAAADARREDAAAALAGVRRFTLRHDPRAPLAWSLALEGDAGGAAWTLPHGLPWAEGEAREAVAGPPPPGAATWDEGACVARPARGGARLELSGRRVRGRYDLRREGGAWSLARLDPPSVRPMPERVIPMLAMPSAYPEDEEAYAFELKWDGIRAIARAKDGKVRFRTRNLVDVTPQYPELAGLGEALDGREALLDGEIAAVDETGRTSFQRLQGRLGVASRREAARRAREIPVVYVVFDLLHLDGHDTTALPYEERRALLESLHLSGPRWQVPPASVGSGRALLALPGVEGVIAKRLGSPYEPGSRSGAWRKVKLQRRQEFVIGGYTAGRGGRSGRIGSIMLGLYDAAPAEADARGEPQRLLYAGNVGTGFTDATLADLAERLAPLRRAGSPFAGPVDKAGVFVEPRLVAEIEFTEWTREGRLRHPSFKGLRFDKDPREVVREER
ncbi:MAG TPA: non-homologous end-joining DNA ligase [Candidatus Thermoplasmatota archaeon]|nr:non-homologous end-joining DNA ligase [Candidatus Thermoplasmatota archaeon]